MYYFIQFMRVRNLVGSWLSQNWFTKSKAVLEKSRFTLRDGYSIWSPKCFRTTKLLWSQNGGQHADSADPPSYLKAHHILPSIWEFLLHLTPAWLKSYQHTAYFSAGPSVCSLLLPSPSAEILGVLSKTKSLSKHKDLGWSIGCNSEVVLTWQV